MKMRQLSSTFATYLPSLLLGALVGVALSLAHYVDLMLVPILLLGMIVLFVFRFSLFPNSVFMVMVAVSLLGISGGILRVGELPSDPPPVSQKNVHIVGLVVREPDKRESYTGVTVKTDIYESSILVYAPKFPELSYGDLISATGTLETPKDFETEGTGRVFPYRKYLEKEGIGYVMKYPTVQKVSGGGGNDVVAALYQVKATFIDALSRHIPEPESSLLSGLLLGGKQSLGAELLDAFRVAGIVHIVVLSGYNMTIVSQWIVAIARPLGFYMSAILGVVGIVLFSIMTGAGATVVRAAIMASIALLARVSGRTNVGGRTLLIAGFVMVIQEPLILLYDPSFQLSFLATLGIIYGVPYLESRTPWLRQMPKFREIAFSTLATQVFVLPLLLYQTGMFSVYALPTNFLVLPLVPLAMFLGFWTGVAGLLYSTLGTILAIPTHLILWVIFQVGTWVAQFPFASLALPAFPLWVSIALYLFLYIILVFVRRLPQVHEGSKGS